jgi:transposase
VLLMKKRAKQSKVLKTDETRVPVQQKKQCKKGRMWAYLGDWHNPYIIFEYTPDRTNQWPLAWLEGFVGFLQADAYSGYDAVYGAGVVIEVGCWAHYPERGFIRSKSSERTFSPGNGHVLLLIIIRLRVTQGIEAHQALAATLAIWSR